MTDASFDPGRASGPESTFRRLARRLAGHGLLGAAAAFLLLKAEAGLPLLLLPLKSAKFYPVALICCAEATWLFGGTVGLLVAVQWLAHEGAHLHALQRLSFAPGWRGLVPGVGPYLGLSPARFPGREAEALVAIAGPMTGLALAGLLFTVGHLLDLPAVATAARLGFLYNLIQMMPIRPFDGGRIFPGLLWRYRSDESADPAAPDAASLRFIGACRTTAAFLNPRRRRTEADIPRLLTEMLVGLLIGLVVLLALVRLLFPPLVFSLLLLAAFAAFAAGIAVIAGLDPRAIPQSRRALFAPRNGKPLDRSNPDRPLPWARPENPRAALFAYLTLLLSLTAGLTLA